MKITEEMMVSEVLDLNENLDTVFHRHGMYCLGCPGAMQETLADAAEAHDVDVNALLEDLNKEVKEL
jgi:hybrid cluster-associated redox disulfide protein